MVVAHSTRRKGEWNNFSISFGNFPKTFSGFNSVVGRSCCCDFYPNFSFLLLVILSCLLVNSNNVHRRDSFFVKFSENQKLRHCSAYHLNINNELWIGIVRFGTWSSFLIYLETESSKINIRNSSFKLFTVFKFLLVEISHPTSTHEFHMASTLDNLRRHHRLHIFIYSNVTQKLFKAQSAKKHWNSERNSARKKAFLGHEKKKISNLELKMFIDLKDNFVW